MKIEARMYTAINTFTPTYDLDGNQTTIQTSTGVWTVEYNAENRPVRWTQGDIAIEMVYDRMGRRIVYHETRNDANYINAKFVYDGYLCIQRLYGASNGVYQSFVWDPTERVATRPLCMQVPSWGATVFYMHDGNKNVSDVIYYAVANGIAAHYDYAPFGAVTRTASNTRMTGRDFIGENPFRFSSEYHDNTLGLVYYNYRHYSPKDGRWCGRDLIEEYSLQCLYNFIKNAPTLTADLLGLKVIISPIESDTRNYETERRKEDFIGGITTVLPKLESTPNKACPSRCKGMYQTMTVTISVTMFVPKKESDYSMALKHELTHVKESAHISSLRDIYLHKGTCLSRSCYEALDQYYSLAQQRITWLVDYYFMILDWHSYKKMHLNNEKELTDPRSIVVNPKAYTELQKIKIAWEDINNTQSLVEKYQRAKKECLDCQIVVPSPEYIFISFPRAPHF